MLGDKAILAAIEAGDIKVNPFFPACLGSNSYDVHLGTTLTRYKPRAKPWWPLRSWVPSWAREALDPKADHETEEVEIPEAGFVIRPGEFWLGVTAEYTEVSDAFVPFFDGKSSGGRLNILTHFTAGKGDAGFKGHWTLEIGCLEPVRLYAGMPIGQLFYFPVVGGVERSYGKKSSAKYQQQGGKPMRSKMYLNWNADGRSWIQGLSASTESTPSQPTR